MFNHDSTSLPMLQDDSSMHEPHQFNVQVNLENKRSRDTIIELYLNVKVRSAQEVSAASTSAHFIF